MEKISVNDSDEYWSACMELNAPVFIHPLNPSRRRVQALALNQTAYTNDTTPTAGPLSAGVMDRFPNLAGGVHPGRTVRIGTALIGRFDRTQGCRWCNVTGNIAAQTPSDYLKRFMTQSCITGRH